jgi:hypothetical protein
MTFSDAYFPRADGRRVPVDAGNLKFTFTGTWQDKPADRSLAVCLSVSLPLFISFPVVVCSLGRLCALALCSLVVLSLSLSLELSLVAYVLLLCVLLFSCLSPSSSLPLLSLSLSMYVHSHIDVHTCV